MYDVTNITTAARSSIGMIYNHPILNQAAPTQPPKARDTAEPTQQTP